MTEEFCKDQEKIARSPRNEIIEYKVVAERLYCEELSAHYSTYGISALKNDKQIAFVSDVSPDRPAVEALVRKCNKYSLDPIHLYDVIEDFLAE